MYTEIPRIGSLHRCRKFYLYYKHRTKGVASLVRLETDLRKRKCKQALKKYFSQSRSFQNLLEHFYLAWIQHFPYRTEEIFFALQNLIRFIIILFLIINRLTHNIIICISIDVAGTTHVLMQSQTSTKENIFTDKIPLFLLVLFTFVEP